MGKTFYQYQLTQSARINGKPKHISVLYLGSTPLLAEKGNRDLLTNLLKERILGQQALDLKKAPATLLKLADEYYQKYKIKNPDDKLGHKTQGKPLTPIDLQSAQLADTREIGSEWMLVQMARQLGLAKALQQKGWGVKDINTALCSIISKTIVACSEHKTAQWLALNSGLGELLGYKTGQTPNRHHLYKAAIRLYECKDYLEEHLYKKTINLFGLQDNLMIYDLTNTYFEGSKQGSTLAQYGRSKEKRNDCKQVVLAAVVNQQGILRHSQIYEGNMSDPTTFKGIIEELEAKSKAGLKQQTLIIDAGIATEDNLKIIREKSLKYVCVSRRALKDYQALTDQDKVIIYDKRGGKIELKIIAPEGEPDQWIYVKSEGKCIKETSMDKQKKERFELELQTVKEALGKKRGTKRYGKVMERIGRIKERYASIHKHYQLDIVHKDDIVTSLSWKIKPANENNEAHGVYFLRTNYTQVEEKQLWEIYNTIREVEATFKCLKTDLNLRPVYHQKDEHTKAHLFLAILAYQLVAPIRYQLKQQGIHHGWSNIVQIMNSQKVANIHLVAETKDITIRICGNPIQQVTDIYKALNFKTKPFKNRKDVVYH